MALSSVLNRWLNRLYKCLAVFVVLFAVLISALRLLLPYAQNYRADVEDYINSTYQSNITIGYLSTDWHSTGPSLIANDVKIIDNDIAEFNVESIDIRLNFWQSLLSQKIITNNFVLSGASLEIDRQLIMDSSSTADSDYDDEKAVLNDLTHFFYEQIERFSLIDSKVTINNDDQQRTFLISELDWININERRLAKADVIVDGLTSNNLKLLLDISGNDNSDMSGQLFIEGNNINITPWLDQVLAIENDKTHSSINLNAWLTIDQGLPQKLQLAFANSEVRWQHQNINHNFALNSGQLLFTHLADFDRLTIHSNDLLFSTNNNDWAPLNVEFNKKDDDLFAYLSTINLSTVSTLLPLFHPEPSLRNAIETMQLQGEVSQLYFQSKAEKLQFTANFADVANNYYQGVPGINHASGELVFNDTKLQIALNAKNGALDFSDNFIIPLPYNELTANVIVDFTQDGWQLKSQQLALHSDELSLSADVGLNVPKDDLTTLSLLATITNGQVDLAHHYFPLTSMSTDLVSYLKRGLVKGDIEQALVLYNGAFANFPFEDHSGIFAVDAEITNSQFNFDDEWADIIDFSANLNFTNNAMMIAGRAGFLTGLDVNGVKVGIADLGKDPVLTVDIDLKNVNPEHVTDLMLNSSLKSTVGQTLEKLKIAKMINGDFSLNLPLNRIDDVVAQGIINFSGNQLALQSPKMEFTDLKGQLKFVNDVITVKDLTLNWHNLPLTVDVDGQDKSSYFNTSIHLDANWPMKKWQVYVPSTLKKYLNGQLNWQGNLALNSHHDGGFSYDADVTSTLKGLGLSLPVPYAKTTKQSTELTLHIDGGLNTSTLDLSLGEQLSFYGLLSHKDNETPPYFSRAHLVLGHEKMLLPMDGFHITSALEYADFFSWQPFVMDILESIEADETTLANSSTQSFIAKPNRIRGTIEKLDVFSQTLHGVSFNVVEQPQWQLLQLNAKEARAEIKFYPSWIEQGIDVDADFIHLFTEEGSMNMATASEDINSKDPEANHVEHIKIEEKTFANIPPMTFSCDDCNVGKLDFGQLNFKIQRPNNDTISINNLVASRNKSSLELQGDWVFDLTSAQASMTSLTGKLIANDIAFEMEKLGFASSIKDSGAVIDFSLNWQGGPQHFVMDDLNGDVNVKFDDGVLTDVDDKGVRVASFLSLGSLARKLKLDFRDIFSEGMFFSSITGDLQINKGIMYTENVELNGSAGDLTVKGNTNLTKGTLDYRMNYKPNLTSSLPTIAWIATLNPVIFITGLAINEIITASVIYEVVFEVTGDIDEPIVKEVDRKNQDISVGSSAPPQVIDDPQIPAELPKSSQGHDFKDIKINNSKVVTANDEVING